MPQLARYRLRFVLYVQMLSAVFNIYYKKNSETWTTLLAYLYDHHIKRSKSLVGAVENN